MEKDTMSGISHGIGQFKNITPHDVEKMERSDTKYLHWWFNTHNTHRILI
jgi:hypothetical protein